MDRDNEYTLSQVSAGELKEALLRSENAQAVILTAPLFRYLVAQAVFGAMAIPIPLIRVNELRSMLACQYEHERIALDFETFSDLALQAIAALEVDTPQN
jgi:hypothetical protein